jgi:hypothetical protein
VRIRVTVDDIADGKQEQEDGCPVALALARFFKMGTNHVRARPDEIVLFLGHLGPEYQVIRRKTPTVVATWMERYDEGLRVTPFEFTLEGLMR